MNRRTCSVRCSSCASISGTVSGTGSGTRPGSIPIDEAPPDGAATAAVDAAVETAFRGAGVPAVLPASAAGAGAGAAALPVVRGITGTVEYSANAKSKHGEFLLRRSGRWIERLFQDEARGRLPHLITRQWLRVIVVQIQTEHAGAWIRALEMVPVVGRHEEQAAMLGVVIAVRARGELFHHRRPVRTGPGCEYVDGGPGTCPRHGNGNLYQLTSVDGTLARRIFHDSGVDGTGPCSIEPNRLELHPALPALPWCIFDHVLVASHRADIGNRRQFLALRGGSRHGRTVARG